MTKAPGGNTPDLSLLRVVGVWGLSAAIFNVTVGGGIFRLPASVAGSIGSAAPIVYLVCAAVMGLIVLCFAEAGSRVSRTGGPYAYVAVVFGPYVGYVAGVLVWMLGTLAVASVSSAFAGAVGTLVGGGLAPSVRAGFLVVLFSMLSWVNTRGVRQGTRLIGVASIAKLLPLLLLVGAGAFFIHPPFLEIPRMPEGATIARAAMVLIFAFTGVESALVPSGEVRDPSRTVPRALAVAMIGITLLYLAIHLVAQGVLGPELASFKDAPLAEAAGRVLGPGGRWVLLIGAIVSMFGYVGGMTLAIPRALFAAASDGILPRAFGAVHPVHRTPYVAIWAQSSLVCALAITSTFEQLAVIANLAALLLYLACALAGLELRRRDIRQGGGEPVSLPGGPLIPLLTCAVILWLFTSITAIEWSLVAGTVAAASVPYAITRRRRAA